MVERKITAHNTGFASGGVVCKLGALCFYSSSVLADSFVLRNAKRFIYVTVIGHFTNEPSINNEF